MPAEICTTCGRMTNSATSNYWSTDGKPTKCWIAVDPNTGLWVKGCAWDDPSNWNRKSFEENYIGNKAIKTAEELRKEAEELFGRGDKND